MTFLYIILLFLLLCAVQFLCQRFNFPSRVLNENNRFLNEKVQGRIAFAMTCGFLAMNLALQFYPGVLCALVLLYLLWPKKSASQAY